MSETEAELIHLVNQYRNEGKIDALYWLLRTLIYGQMATVRAVSRLNKEVFPEAFASTESE